MWKRPLFLSMAVSAGSTLGACVLPRLMHPENYGPDWPPLWINALTYFVVGTAVSFAILYLLQRRRAKKGISRMGKKRR